MDINLIVTMVKARIGLNDRMLKAEIIAAIKGAMGW